MLILSFFPMFKEVCARKLKNESNYPQNTTVYGKVLLKF